MQLIMLPRSRKALELKDILVSKKHKATDDCTFISEEKNGCNVATFFKQILTNQNQEILKLDLG